MNSWQLSLAVVTRNRPESLLRFLQSIEHQKVQPFEILISDDSDPLEAEAVRALAARFKCRYAAGPRRGLYANRNAAALNCRGTHILSADDDHTHPDTYISTAMQLIGEDPRRVWVFAEKWPNRLDDQVTCPPELDRSGHGRSPVDPSCCAAIADGSTVYPRQIFESGLRYDETYSFGPMWYLWGRTLAAAGWRITFSDKTYVIHHWVEAYQQRANDREFIQAQKEAMLYAAWINAFCFERSITTLCYCIYRTARAVCVSDGVFLIEGKSRLPIGKALRAMRRARKQARNPPANAITGKREN